MNAMRILVGFTALAVTTGAYALDGVWVNGETSAKQAWRTVGNWTDSSGAPAADFPKAAGDTATLTAPSDYRLQTIYTGGNDSNGYGLTLDSVSGSAQHTINFGDSQTLGYTSQNYHYLTSDQKLTLTDPSNFFGYWANNIGRLFFSLKATAQNTPVLHALSLAGRPGVEVPTAGTTAVVGNVYESGALVKTGNGELRIDTLDSGKDTIFVNAGSLTFGGENDAEVVALLQRAAVRFDASATNTLETQEGADGLTAVTRWNDANGGTLYAYPAAYPGSGMFLSFVRAPFLSAARSPTGLPYVDFGARRASDVDELGPTNCNLRLTARLTNVREIFIAADYPKSMIGCTAVGDMDTYHLVPDLTYDQFVQFGGGDKQYNRTTQGDLTLNCTKVTCDGCKPSTVSGLNVLSISPLADVAVQTLGTGCCRTDFNGGLRLGEAIVFTNVLSRAERTLLNRYLMRKWKGQGADRMAGNVFVATANTPIGVPADRSAHVAEVVATAGTLTKTGGGTLVIDRLSPATAKIVVQGGSVKVNPTAAPVKQVRGTPYIWLDAKKIADSGKAKFDGNPTNYVHSWIDCREGVTTAATGIYSTAPRMAYVEEDAVGPGLPAVSFGLKAWGNHSHMQFPNWTSGSARAGFAVVRPLATNVDMPLFGSSMLGTMREVGRIAHRNTIQPNLTTARWAINGTPVDPLAVLPELTQNQDFFLISFTADRAINTGGIAGQRTDTTTYPNECGGWEVAEMIVYNTALTEEERRDTEAYLLDKWLKKDHPVASAFVGAIEYAADAEQVVDTDENVAIGQVKGHEGAFVKRGSGAASVASLEGVDAVEVEGGSLTVTLPQKPLDDFSPISHFDAMQISTLTWNVPEGGSVTNVTDWKSTVGTRVAKSEAKYYGKDNCGGIVDPTLKSVQIGSSEKPTISFGDVGKTAAPVSDAAAMRFNTGMSGILELHEIVADSSTKTDKECLFDNYNQIVWLRGVGTKLFDTNYGYTYKQVLAGYIAVDGEEKAASYNLPSGFHLLSVAPTSTVATTGFANDRFCLMGGLNISEYIAFGRTLNAKERDYVQKFLMAKWFDAEMPSWPFAYDSLSIAAGATMSFDGAAAVTVPSISGGGTLDAKSVDGVSALNFTYTDRETWDSLTLKGDVTFADTVTVTVTAADPKRVKKGEYTLLTVEDADTVEIPALQLNLVNFPTGRVVTSLVKVGNALVLKIEPHGLSVIIR